MAVIPLTLAISLCLAFTFIVFFLREQHRRRFSSDESESLLPLADETPRTVPAPAKASCAGKAGCSCAGCPRHDHSSPSTIAA